MIKTIEKDISKEDYKLKINNNHVKILPTHPDAYRKLTKLLKTLNAKFHTYQLKQERPVRVVLRNIHHSVDLDELKCELLNHGHEVTNISNIRHRITKIYFYIYCYIYFIFIVYLFVTEHFTKLS